MRIKINDVYSYDVDNLEKRKASEAIYNVQVLQKKRRLFKRSLYKVRCISSGSIFYCTKKMLTPYPSNFNESMNRVYLRFPDDMPAITEEDICVIYDLLKIVSKSTDLYTYCFKLKTKLEYYHNARNV